MTKKTNNKTNNNQGNHFKISEECNSLAMVKDNDNKIKIVMGRYVISGKKFKSFEEAEEYIKSKPWELIINIAYFFSNVKKYENENQNNRADNKKTAKEN